MSRLNAPCAAVGVSRPVRTAGRQQAQRQVLRSPSARVRMPRACRRSLWPHASGAPAAQGERGVRDRRGAWGGVGAQAAAVRVWDACVLAQRTAPAQRDSASARACRSSDAAPEKRTQLGAQRRRTCAAARPQGKRVRNRAVRNGCAVERRFRRRRTAARELGRGSALGAPCVHGSQPCAVRRTSAGTASTLGRVPAPRKASGGARW